MYTKSRFNLVLDEDLDLQVRLKATENRQTISDFVAEALRHYLKNYARIQKQAQKNKEPEIEY
ncbi:hypothetical protein Syn7502_00837 [Synechococcus sp. PCC 7502]|uniref:hypothetical protein n=1 Tax=Synechococcus sp. PCC 7502 TaxID=1173263 RepID=UPI00029FE33E|nr:hypothetical protein [Synechococcus sp. PCC 7502]AFY72969.1 hypothetical protein Syn7502_00837 [Synechococcus sp. PCC 7502]